MVGSTFFAVIFFLMMITLGLDSTVGTSTMRGSTGGDRGSRFAVSRSPASPRHFLGSLGAWRQ